MSYHAQAIKGRDTDITKEFIDTVVRQFSGDGARNKYGVAGVNQFFSDIRSEKTFQNQYRYSVGGDRSGTDRLDTYINDAQDRVLSHLFPATPQEQRADQRIQSSHVGGAGGQGREREPWQSEAERLEDREKGGAKTPWGTQEDTGSGGRTWNAEAGQWEAGGGSGGGGGGSYDADGGDIERDKFGLQAILDEIGPLELNRFTREPDVELSDEQRQLIKQVAGMSEEGSAFDKMLKGEVDFGRAERLFNMQRNNMRNQFLPMIEGQMAASGNLNSGSMQRATERAVGEQAGREAETMFKMDQAAMDRSIQAGNLLPIISSVLDMPRQNEIANIERDFQVHMANEGLTVQEFQGEISLLQEAQALAQLDISAFSSEAQADYWMGQLDLMNQRLEFDRMKFAEEMKAREEAAKGSMFSSILGIAGTAIGMGFGPMGAMIGGQLGQAAGSAIGGNWGQAAAGVGQMGSTMVGAEILGSKYPSLWGSQGSPFGGGGGDSALGFGSSRAFPAATWDGIYEKP